MSKQDKIDKIKSQGTQELLKTVVQQNIEKEQLQKQVDNLQQEVSVQSELLADYKLTELRIAYMLKLLLEDLTHRKVIFGEYLTGEKHISEINEEILDKLWEEIKP